MKTKTIYRQERERQKQLTKITIAFFLIAIVLSGFTN